MPPVVSISPPDWAAAAAPRAGSAARGATWLPAKAIEWQSSSSEEPAANPLLRLPPARPPLYAGRVARALPSLDAGSKWREAMPSPLRLSCTEPDAIRSSVISRQECHVAQCASAAINAVGRARPPCASAQPSGLPRVCTEQQRGARGHAPSATARCWLWRPARRSRLQQPSHRAGMPPGRTRRWASRARAWQAPGQGSASAAFRP
jgi:hypothetical protein